MTKKEFERELSSATGESVGEIRRRGFQLLVVPDRAPLVMEWDQEIEIPRYRPRRPPVHRRVAA